MDETKSLGTEKISKLLLKFAIPCITGLVISALYNVVDQIFIGNSSLGYLGNAATGISFPIICIASAFAWSLGDGAAAFLSICAGRNDTESAHKCVGTSITSAAIISVILMAVCLIFKTPLMILFGASENTLGLATDYFGIIAAFLPAYMLFGVMNSIIRSDGSPNYSMIATCSGAISNIVLDYVFIYVFNWGIKGAAWATVTGQTITFIVDLLYFRHPKTFKLLKESFKIDMNILKSLVNLGGATFITQVSVVIMSLLSNITLFHFGALSIYGSDIPISVFSVQTKVYTIIINIVVGIALGSQPILGYNYGANRMDRVKECYSLILKSSVTIGIIATMIFEFCPQIIINIFGKGNPLYMEFATKTFRIYLPFSIVTCIIKMTGIFFQSIGKSIEAMVAAVIRDMVCFVVLTIGLSFFFESRLPGSGIYGILFAAPISDIIAGGVVVVLTKKFFSKLKIEKEEPVQTMVIRPSHPGTIITIAREHGSCGKQIGKLVAQQLGIPFYYKEMTALAAQESGLDKEFVSDINRNSSNILHQLYLSSNVVQQAVIAQEKIIRKIADNGACVIVGRAADYVLRDYDNVVRVFMHAPDDVRIKNIKEMYSDEPEQAIINMRHSDEARSSYYKNISGRDWRDLKNYNLSINTSIGKEKSAELIVSYIKNQAI